MIWTTRPRSEGPGGLAYCVEGAGPALVLLHGVGLRAEAWNAVSQHLADRFRVYAVDLPGHGASEHTAGLQLEGYSTRVRDFVQSLGCPAYIAGHSMGAMIALDAAPRMPDCIRGVAGLNAIYRRSPDAQAAVRARADLLSESSVSDPTATLARWFGTTPDTRDAEAASACRAWLTQANPEGYAAAYRVFAQHDGPIDTQLHALQMPALFQTGAKDPNSTPSMSRAMAAKAPFGIAESVDHAAHMMPMTHPDAVAQAITACFLDREAGRC